MASQNLQDLSITESLAAVVSQLLGSSDIPNVLWGNFLLTVYGIPSITSDLAFVVPDDKISATEKALCNSDLDICKDQRCVVSDNITHPTPTIHFHLQQDDLHISIYLQSQALPNVPDMTDPAADIISASDSRLPKSQIGYGSGAFSAKYQSVRIPSPECFTHSCLVNFARLARKIDPWCAHDLYYLGWASYMIEYVYLRGYLDLNYLPKIIREFLIDAFIKEGADSFVAARKRLIASEA